tara:strand:+ start:40 stop:501 length:462 start_codon:yes stop_codon:yes gene_type:complete
MRRVIEISKLYAIDNLLPADSMSTEMCDDLFQAFCPEAESEKVIIRTVDGTLTFNYYKVVIEKGGLAFGILEKNNTLFFSKKDVYSDASIIEALEQSQRKEATKEVVDFLEKNRLVKNTRTITSLVNLGRKPVLEPTVFRTVLGAPNLKLPPE